MPMTPPQVRLPMSLPSPSVLKRYGKISPSDAENSLISVTMGPVNVCGGSVCGIPLRAIPIITSAPQSFDHQRRDKSATVTSNIDNERVLPDLRKVKLRELVQTGPAHVRNVQIADF